MQSFGRAGLGKGEFHVLKSNWTNLLFLGTASVFPVLELGLVTPTQERSSWSFLPACLPPALSLLALTGPGQVPVTAVGQAASPQTRG